MSIVAWDGKHLVSDNQVTHGNVPKKCKKIFKFVRKGIIHGAGFVGTACEGIELIDWYKNGAHQENWPGHKDTELLVCTSEWCSSYSESPLPLPILESYYATGSGTDFATSALSMGQTAKEAVLHAIEHDIYCGMGTTSIKLCT